MTTDVINGVPRSLLERCALLAQDAMGVDFDEHAAIERDIRALLATAQPAADGERGEYGDAYQGAREDMAIWKRRALEAEAKVREQDRIIENLGNALNDENGPTFMGEPVLQARAAQPQQAVAVTDEVIRLREALEKAAIHVRPTCKELYDELCSALSAQQSAPERVSVPVELLEQVLNVMDNYVTHETREEDQLRAILASHQRGEA